MCRLVRGLSWGVLVVLASSARLSVADDPPRTPSATANSAGRAPGADADAAQIERFLASKGLHRVGSAFVSTTEEEVRRRLAVLETLVGQNLAALGRRQLRSGIMSGSHSLYLGLQTQRLGMQALAMQGGGLSTPYAFYYPHSMIAPFERQAFFRSQAGYLNREIVGLNNVIAGVQADDAAEAAEALGRQDDFMQGVAALTRLIDEMDRGYDRLKRDNEVQAALARLTRLENRPLTLGPLEDYRAKLQSLVSSMDETRVLTTAPGRVAPNYATAALLAEAARRDLRMALGRLEEARRKAGTDLAALVPLEREVAARRARYIRAAAILRASYDAVPPEPAPAPVAVRTATGEAAPGQIRALVEQHRAGLRASYVTEFERAIHTARVPLEREGGALWVTASVNGLPGQRMRVDPSADVMCVPERLAKSYGLRLDGSAATGTVHTSRGDLVGRWATVRSVQVGPFTAENVLCLVVPGEDAPILPGAGALGPLLARLDDTTNPPSLTLTRIDVSPIPPLTLPPGAPQPKVRQRADAGTPNPAPIR
jgi:hypothetical protein